jgi:hypothetical protein
MELMEFKKRKLASLQTVVSVSPIENADAIEKITVLGWECIVKKEEKIKVGDLIVYIEIDSIAPPVEPFIFLEQRKYRVRTIKLRGVYSQGLALPLAYFPKIFSKVKDNILKEGDDLTELLGIIKYDPELQKERQTANVKIKHSPIREFFMQFYWFRRLHHKFFPGQKKGWPEFIRKTDEDRIQSMPSVLQKYTDKEWYVTEKLDGQSASYFITKKKSFFGTKFVFGVCSRNIYMKTKHNCNWWNVADKYKIKEILKSVNENICVQGEIIGPTIQGNKYGISELKFYVFNVYDINNQKYYEYDDLKKFCYSYGFEMVPVVEHFSEMTLNVQEIIKYSIGKSVLNKQIHREGLVFRTINNVNKNNINNEPVSFKAINPDFLLKYQDEEN